ncbi:MAG: hypothetical protein DRO13_00735 [Thermoprotei archaeon]|nr:MAG: hypothetical protein DRO13_00735 [Thermoprotei archaeon]
MDRKPLFLDLSIKSRNLKAIAKRLELSRFNERKFPIYYFKEGELLYKVITIKPPTTEYVEEIRFDELSGLTYKIREAVLKIARQDFLRIYWSRSWYRVKVNYSPFTIRILIDIGE